MALLVYDISTKDPEGASRLRRVAKTCESYAIRVQDSVFEFLGNRAVWTVFKTELLSKIDPKVDSVRIYFLGKHWKDRLEHYGEDIPPESDGLLIL